MKQWERMWNKIEKEIVKSIWEVEGEVYDGTNLGNTKCE